MFCSNCGNALADNDKFCCKCGSAVAAAVVEEAPVAEVPAPVAEPVVEPAYVAPVAEPVYTAPTYVAPAVAAEPVVSTKDKVLGFVGMGLSIFSVFIASICVMVLMGLLDTGVGIAGLLVSIVYGMLSLPPAIIGRILCTKSMEAGNNSAPCNVGIKLSLVGFILTGVKLFFGFICSVS